MINETELLLRQSNGSSGRTLDMQLLSFDTKKVTYEGVNSGKVYKAKWHQASMTSRTLSFCGDTIQRYGNEMYYLQIG